MLTSLMVYVLFFSHQNECTMVLYQVTWQLSPEHSKGKKRMDKGIQIISVICRSSKDALNALTWHFSQVYDTTLMDGITLDDGIITLKRSVVDSRNFNAKYLYMDGMKSPLSLGDLSQSLFDYAHRHFKGCISL